MEVAPNHPFADGFSTSFSIHLGVPPWPWKTPYMNPCNFTNESPKSGLHSNHLP